MPIKKKGPMLVSLVIIGILVGSAALGLYIKRSKNQGTPTRNPQIVRRQMGSVREGTTVKGHIPKASAPSTTQTTKGQEAEALSRPAGTAPPPSPVEKPEPKVPAEYEQEMTRLNKLIKLDERNADAFYRRGYLEEQKGDLQLAERDYTKTIQINRTSNDAYYNRGLVLVGMKRFQQAVDDFSEALKLDPNAVDAYCNRGNAYFQMGKTDAALADYNEAVRLNPDDPDLYYNRAIAYGAKGDESKSVADYRKAANLGHEKAREYLKLPSPKAEKEKPTPQNATVAWGMDPTHVNIPNQRASGEIHGEPFKMETAQIENGILTLRQGKQVFADRSVMIFLFLKKDERIEDKTYDISKDQGLGAPPIHMKWKVEGKDIPETEIFMKNYAMHLQFGRKRRNYVSGKIYLSLPDELKSYVFGTFMAKVE